MGRLPTSAEHRKKANAERVRRHRIKKNARDVSGGVTGATRRRKNESWWLALQRAQITAFRQYWLSPCDHCGCKILNTESRAWCCSNGRTLTNKLPDYPREVSRVLLDGSQSQVSRLLNRQFSFTLLGIEGDGHFVNHSQNQARQIPQDVCIQGKMYHWIPDLATGSHPLR